MHGTYPLENILVDSGSVTIFFGGIGAIVNSDDMIHLVTIQKDWRASQALSLYEIIVEDYIASLSGFHVEQ